MLGSIPCHHESLHSEGRRASHPHNRSQCIDHIDESLGLVVEEKGGEEFGSEAGQRDDDDCLLQGEAVQDQAQRNVCEDDGQVAADVEPVELD